MTSNRYSVVLADPSWQFTNVNTGGSLTSGSAHQYPVMSLRELHGLPVLPLVARNAVLFLWVPTSLKFSHGPSTAAAWGFSRYVSTLYWKKTGGRLGMGFWFRNCVEELLLFKRGDPRPFRCQERNAIDSLPLEHSAKPEEFRHLIERATVSMSMTDSELLKLAEGPVTTPVRRLELFARERAEGWTSLGDEIDGRDLRVSLPALAKTLAGER